MTKPGFRRADNRLYLVRIDDRPYGFTVVAILAKDEGQARQFATEKHGASWAGEVWRHGRAQIIDRAPGRRGDTVKMEFSE